jgi:hypothetical protein
MSTWKGPRSPKAPPSNAALPDARLPSRWQQRFPDRRHGARLNATFHARSPSQNQKSRNQTGLSVAAVGNPGRREGQARAGRVVECGLPVRSGKSAPPAGRGGHGSRMQVAHSRGAARVRGATFARRPTGPAARRLIALRPEPDGLDAGVECQRHGAQAHRQVPLDGMLDHALTEPGEQRSTAERVALGVAWRT